VTGFGVPTPPETAIKGFGVKTRFADPTNSWDWTEKEKRKKNEINGRITLNLWVLQILVFILKIWEALEFCLIDKINR